MAARVRPFTEGRVSGASGSTRGNVSQSAGVAYHRVFTVLMCNKIYGTG